MGRILVTDDEVVLVGLVSEVLTSAGHEVSVAYGGEEAVVLATREKPDVILLDWMMPGVDGGEVARKLKKRGNRARVILFSAISNIQEKADCISADGYLAKPFSIDDLLDTVERCL